jgi:hypothetical protein
MEKTLAKMAMAYVGKRAVARIGLGKLAIGGLVGLAVAAALDRAQQDGSSEPAEEPSQDGDEE